MAGRMSISVVMLTLLVMWVSCTPQRVSAQGARFLITEYGAVGDAQTVNVRIINVSGTTSNVGDIRGLKGSPVRNVTFENCHIKARRGLLLENVRDLDLSGLTIEVEEGEAITRRNAE